MKTELLRGGEALFWAVFAITVGGACRLLLVNFEGAGTTWFTWRYIGLVASIGLIAIPPEQRGLLGAILDWWPVSA